MSNWEYRYWVEDIEWEEPRADLPKYAAVFLSDTWVDGDGDVENFEPHGSDADNDSHEHSAQAEDACDTAWDAEVIAALEEQYGGEGKGNR